MTNVSSILYLYELTCRAVSFLDLFGITLHQEVSQVGAGVGGLGVGAEVEDYFREIQILNIIRFFIFYRKERKLTRQTSQCFSAEARHQQACGQIFDHDKLQCFPLRQHSRPWAKISSYQFVHLLFLTPPSRPFILNAIRHETPSNNSDRLLSKFLSIFFVK